MIHMLGPRHRRWYVLYALSIWRMISIFLKRVTFRSIRDAVETRMPSLEVAPTTLETFSPPKNAPLLLLIYSFSMIFVFGSRYATVVHLNSQ